MKEERLPNAELDAICSVAKAAFEHRDRFAAEMTIRQVAGHVIVRTFGWVVKD